LGDGEVVTSAVKPVSSYLTIRAIILCRRQKPGHDGRVG
jgi:hypothetical protein